MKKLVEVIRSDERELMYRVQEAGFEGPEYGRWTSQMLTREAARQLRDLLNEWLADEVGGSRD